MHWSSIATLALAHVAAVVALPGDGLFKRQACNRDNCFRAVAGNASLPSAPVRQQDCSAFQTTTTAACTLVITVTSTATAPTITTTGNLNITSTFTQIVNVSATIFQSFTNTTTSVSTVFTTDVSTATSTNLTVYSYTPPAQLRRRATPSLVCGANFTTRVPPTYASACSGAVRYASACACFGITATTIVQATETSTITSTITTTPYVGINATSVISNNVTITQTANITSTTFIAQTNRTTTTVITNTTTTVNAQATVTNKFAIQVGDAAGTYVARDATDDNAAIFAPGTLQQALVFTLDSGKLVLFDNSSVVALSKGDFNPVAIVNAATFDSAKNSIITCTVARTKSTNGTSGGYPLTCTDPDSPFPAVRSGAWFFQSRAPTVQFPTLYAVSPYNNPSQPANVTA